MLLRARLEASWGFYQSKAYYVLGGGNAVGLSEEMKKEGLGNGVIKVFETLRLRVGGSG
jgi:hypothetical protein